MRSLKRRNRYEDELGRLKRVDRSALGVIAKRVASKKRAEPHITHDLYILDAKAPPERLGKRRK